MAKISTQINDSKRDNAEKQVAEEQRLVSFDTKEFTVELLVNKFKDEQEEEGDALIQGEGEIMIPDYQRDFVWEEKRQSRFIESLLMELPVPYIFAADREVDGVLEIIDGSQRLRTLKNFLSNDLKLVDLEILEKLNGFKFSDLPLVLQRKFKNRTIRMVVIDEKGNGDIKYKLFERLNTGGINLEEMQVRKGAYSQAFYKFLRECACMPKFNKLCPLGKRGKVNNEGEELVLRFFSYSENYLKFRHDVGKFHNNYMQSKKDNFGETEMKERFERMINFVDDYFPYGFRKSPQSNTTSRVRFEAIAVGVHLALEIDSQIKPTDFSWLDDAIFKQHVESGGSNSAARLRGRVEYVRDKLLDRI